MVCWIRRWRARCAWSFDRLDSRSLASEGQPSPSLSQIRLGERGGEVFGHGDDALFVAGQQRDLERWFGFNRSCGGVGLLQRHIVPP